MCKDVGFISCTVKNAQTPAKISNEEEFFKFSNQPQNTHSLTLKPCNEYMQKASALFSCVNTDCRKCRQRSRFSPPNLSLVAVSFCYTATCLPPFSQAGDIALKEVFGHELYDPHGCSGDSKHFIHTYAARVHKQRVQLQHNVITKQF